MTMKKQAVNNAKLGVFVIAGLLVLVVSLYVIGQNHNFFGSGFALKARFRDVNGLMPGSNVRFSGIQCGTVKDIEIINDTTIEVRMLINNKTSPYIRANASASIGTEGLMGNKVVNILPNAAGAPPMENGGMLVTGGQPGLEDMMGTLSVVGNNTLEVSASLREAALKINNSPLLQQLLTDTTMVTNLQQSLAHFRKASLNIENAAASVNLMLLNVQKGEGVAGVLLSDRQAAANTAEAIENLNYASRQANKLVTDIDSLVSEIHADAAGGNGALHLLLKDTTLVNRLNNSLENIENGTAAFNEDMEALKHNFLLRGYFRKQEKRKE